MIQLSHQFSVLRMRPRRSDCQGARRAVSVRFDGGRPDALLRRAPFFFARRTHCRRRRGAPGAQRGRRRPHRARAFARPAPGRGSWPVARGARRGAWRPWGGGGGNEGGLRARRPRARTVGGARGRVRAGAATWGGAPWLPAGSPGGAPGAARPMERAARRTATRHECSAVGDPRAGAYEHRGRLARCVAGCPQLQ